MASAPPNALVEDIVGCVGCPNSPFCLARGLSGDSAGRTVTGGATSPVTRRRIGGRLTSARPTPSPDRDPGSVDLLSWDPNELPNAIRSAPRACRRDFSCLFWTARKWLRSSCHLISSRPILVRAARGTALDIGYISPALADQGRYTRFRSYMKKTSRIDCIQSIA